MKISEINLEYVKNHVKADDDDVRLLQHLESAKDMIMKANGFETVEEMDQDEFLVDVLLCWVEQLYDTGQIIDNKAFNNLLTMDRRF